MKTRTIRSITVIGALASNNRNSNTRLPSPRKKEKEELSPPMIYWRRRCGGRRSNEANTCPRAIHSYYGKTLFLQHWIGKK
jgi:hypothetical protein